MTESVNQYFDFSKPTIERGPGWGREKAKGSSEYKQRERWRRDPGAFLREAMEWPRGQSPTPYQLEILENLVRYRRATVRGPHGLGKTSVSAWAVLWFAISSDKDYSWKVPTLASAWRQVQEYLWPEIHLWARRLKWDVIGCSPWNTTTLQTLSLELETGHAFAMAAKDESAIEGAHGERLLYLFDEAKAIPPKFWEAAEGAFSGGGEGGPSESLWLAVSTPSEEPQGVFYDIHNRKPGTEDWWVRHVTLEEAISAGRVTRAWAEKRKKDWGENSAAYRTRVLGEFAEAAENGLIPLSWIKAAQERWREWQKRIEKRGGKLPALTCVAADVAQGSGRDRSIIARRYGDHIMLDKYAWTDTMQLAGRVAGILERSAAFAAVDVPGVGAGCYHRLRELEYDVIPWNGKNFTRERDMSGELGFVNCRSYAWWNLRELLDPSNGATLGLPPDADLEQDLTAPKYSVTSSGKIAVETKEEVKRRLKRSPDCGDAVVISLAVRRPYAPSSVHLENDGVAL